MGRQGLPSKARRQQVRQQRGNVLTLLSACSKSRAHHSNDESDLQQKQIRPQLSLLQG